MAPKTEQTVVSFQAPRAMAERLGALARANERTVSAEIRRAVSAHLEHDPPVEGDPLP